MILTKIRFMAYYSERATYPDWSPEGAQIVYVAHKNSVSNLYTMGIDGSDKIQITNYVYDTQILNPHYSHDGILLFLPWQIRKQTWIYLS
ncbi:MAG: hypothetical protein CM1200mP10_12780 [Candidatus Neomarinimicrobiota bacterium]|nr:MAG: hypothetical protein CM1200mP10_12780 [Candidatus Neomarinimicrobiota bacterium]